MSQYSHLSPRLLKVVFISAVMFFLPSCQASSIATPDQSNHPTATDLPLQPDPGTPTAEPTIRATYTANPTSRTSITTTPTLLEEPLNLVNPKVVILAEHLSNPDDLALAPDGSILVSNIGDGSIQQVTPDGKLKTILTGLDEPEGMVFLPDGTLIIAEQGKNRLVRFDLQSKSISPFINLQNKTTQAGVDGIVLDSHNPAILSLIIPDSPNGAILRASLDGKVITDITHSFSRPTAAWVERDGSILVVDENAHSLSRIHPDGKIQTLARNLPTPDDVIEDNGGHIFVNTLTDGAIHLLSEDGRQDSILVSHLAGPQGEIFDSDGNLVVSDSGNDRLLKILIH
jgi:sugar lactone lactonase YvrE